MSRGSAVAAERYSSQLPGPAAVPQKPRLASTFTAKKGGFREDKLLLNVYFTLVLKDFLVTAFTTVQILKQNGLFSPPSKLQIADVQNIYGNKAWGVTELENDRRSLQL